MKYTENLGLRKPDDTNFASNDDLNYNADVIDQVIGDISDMLDAINGEVI